MAISRLVPESYNEAYAAVITGQEGTGSGGTEVTSGGFKYHVFTGTGSFVISDGYKAFEYLIVGAGGKAVTGGGGGGGISNGTAKAVSTTVTVTVGAGGTGTDADGNGNKGEESSIAWPTTTGNSQTILAPGGGGGLSGSNTGAETESAHGASGGGGAKLRAFNGVTYYDNSAGGDGLKTIATIYPTNILVNDDATYGADGGNATGTLSANNSFAGAGGGGAVNDGADYTSTTGGAGAGGDGTDAFSAWCSAVSGSVTVGEDSGGTYYICGGGSGQGRHSGGAVTNSTGGLGGGGSSGAGDANTGGGGGRGGDGGSGFVIIRYAV